MVWRSSRLALACAFAAGLIATPAQARPSIFVQASAVGSHGGFEQMRLDFECAATDPVHLNVILTNCSIGGLYASGTGGCFECPPLLADHAVGSGTVRLGGSYQLCVAATSYSAAGWQNVSKCAPLDPITFTAVIAG